MPTNLQQLGRPSPARRSLPPQCLLPLLLNYHLFAAAFSPRARRCEYNQSGGGRLPLPADASTVCAGRAVTLYHFTATIPLNPARRTSSYCCLLRRFA